MLQNHPTPENGNHPTSASMKISSIALVLLFICAAALISCGDGAMQPPGKQTSESFINQIMVKYSESSRLARMSAEIERNGFQPTAINETGKFVTMTIPEGMTPEEAVTLLSRDPAVEYAEPDQVARIAFVPNDPQWNKQWNFRMIRASEAWDVMEAQLGEANRGGNRSIVVAVIDTGVAYENYANYKKGSDFAQTSFVAGYDFYNGDAHPNDDHGHGTHVAGTIAESTDNGLGASGLAYNVSIMPVKVMGSSGEGTYSTVINGIYWAVNHGADVINMSLEGDQASLLLKEALEYAWTKNVVVVAAAGNENGSVRYPARYNDLCISVGAVDYYGIRTDYSNYGPNLDLTAPGGTNNHPIIQETFSGNPAALSFAGRYGTSMAAPHVAAAAALLLSVEALSPAEVESTLKDTANDLGDEGVDNYYGSGLIDAAAALALVTGIRIEPEISPEAIVVDNGDPGTSYSGYWGLSSVPGGYQGDSMATLGGISAVYRWTPKPAVNQKIFAGVYDVYLWWTSSANRTSQAPATVFHTLGQTEILIDQRTNGGKWNYLGSWRLDPNLPVWVEISGRNGQTSADAVKFVWKGNNSEGPDNTPPTANDDAAETTENTSVSINVLANDFDEDGDPINISGTTKPMNGSVYTGANNILTYSPDLGFIGTDTFEYTISDGNGAFDSAEVAVDVVPDGSEPTPPALELIIDNGDPETSYNGFWQPSSAPGGYNGGSMATPGGARNTYRWTIESIPEADYDLYVWWTSSAKRSSNVPITVQHANGALEIIVDQTYGGGKWNHMGRFSFDPATASWIEVSGRNGQASADAVKIISAGAIIDPGPNTPPTAVNDHASTTEGISIEIDVLANDGDADGDQIFIYQLEQPLFGSTALNTTDIVVYTPQANFTGIDSFMYTISDGNGGYASATATVTVGSGSTQPPQPTVELIIDNGDPATSYNGYWVPSSAPGGYNGDSMATPGGSRNTYRWTIENLLHGKYDAYIWWTASPNRSGSVPATIMHASGSTELILDQTSNGSQWNHLGAYVFNSAYPSWIEISGQNGQASADAVRLITSGIIVDPQPEPGTNTPPTAVNDQAVTEKNTPVNIDVLANDHDADGDALFVSELGQPLFGSVDFGPENLLTYTPNNDILGMDSFEYKISDGNGGQDTANVIITIQPKSPPPPPTTAYEQVIDNGEPGTSQTGLWLRSSAPGGFNNESLATPGGSGSKYRWTPQPLPEEYYDVYMWWAASEYRSAEVPIIINHAEGSTEIYANQQNNGGQWNYLGTWRFTKTTSAWIEISGTNGQACADAVKFVSSGQAITQASE